VTSPFQPPAITPEQFELFQRLTSIFMPHATRQIKRAYPDKKLARFVHYTSAEAALKIINTRRLWMRNTNCMSDFSEVQHGFGILNNVFSDKSTRNKFVAAMDAFSPGAAEAAITTFNQQWSETRFSTYIACLSEHDENEDTHGRLSMWRAVGLSGARVGIVIRAPFRSDGVLALRLSFSPVAYWGETSLSEVLDEIVENTRVSREFLSKLDRQVVVGAIFAMLLTAVVCVKHEGFREEREWRVIYSPTTRPSSLMESSTEIVGGVPQIVYRIPLDLTVSHLIADLDLPHIFDRLILGPSPYPWPMYGAFVSALKNAGVADAENRVVVSGIPIRTI
jgi:hypothetical protein